MKSTTRYMFLLILTGISLSSFQYTFSQTYEETLGFAENQFAAGNFETASKAYRRALFFGDGSDNLKIFNRIAEIAFKEKDYAAARRYYEAAYNVASDDSMRTVLLFNKASCYMLSSNYRLALIDLLSVTDTSKIVRRRVDFYLGTCYYGLDDFTKALDYFTLCVPDENREELDILFRERKLNRPSPSKARILSMIVPGLGQAYSGDIKDALNSLFLNAGLIVLGIRISGLYSPWDAVFAVLPWFQRYYTGGYLKAEGIAERRLEKNRDDIYLRILQLIARQNNAK